MVSLTWVRMPTVGSGSASVRPKYPLEGETVVVFRGSVAYVAVDKKLENALKRHADVHVLRPSEMGDLQATFPTVRTSSAEHGARTVRLGDLVQDVTTKIGLRPCEACRKRKALLDRVIVWGWWRPRGL